MNSKSIFTLEQRIRIYTRAIELIKVGYEYSYCCTAFWYILFVELKFEEKYSIEKDFPEFWLQRPSDDSKLGQKWWPGTFVGQQARIQALNRALSIVLGKHAKKLSNQS